MLSTMIKGLFAGNIISKLVVGALKTIEELNIATDLQRSRAERAKARKLALKNTFQAGIPLAVGIGVAAGVPQGGVAMSIPLAMLAHQIDKATGLSQVLANVVSPLLAPVTNAIGWIKRKIKKHLKMDTTKWVEKGLKMTMPLAVASEAATGLGLDALYKASPVIQHLRDSQQNKEDNDVAMEFFGSQTDMQRENTKKNVIAS